MEVRRLDKLVEFFVDGSLALSTKRAYESGQRKYLSFCGRVGAPPLPLKEDGLCRFVSSLAEEGLRHTTIKGYLSAVRKMQIVGGLGDPFIASWPLLECTLRGVKLSQAKSFGNQACKREVTSDSKDFENAEEVLGE